MNNSRRTLIATIAGFTALGLAIMAVFYWAALAVPAYTLDLGQIDLPLRLLVIGAIISFSIYILATPESVGRTVGKRSTRLTANALVASIVAVAIAIVINMIVEAAPAARADLTAGQEFTLSQQTIRVIQDLDRRNANVTAVGFFSQNDPSRNPQTITQAEDLFKEYRSHSSRFRYEFVDPEAQPQRASQYNISRFGVVVLEDGRKREIADSASERDLTSALVRLSNTTPRTVAFLTGHGERDFNSLDQDGYSQAKESLAQNNYQTLVWSLVTSPTLTVSDVTVLIIAAPIRALPANEVQIIQTYLDGGGHALMLLDPSMPPEALQSLNPILSKYGVTPQQGFALDLAKRIQQDPSVILVDSYPLTDITEALSKNRLPTIFPLAFGLAITNTVPGFTSKALVNTSGVPPVSWLETNIESQQVAYEEGQDVPGPVNLAVSVEPSDPTATAPVTDTATVTPTNQVSTRLVVFSDVDFAANFLLSGQAPFNSDLFGNSVSWLAGANELVSIRAKDASAPRTITLDAGQKNLIFTATVLGLPMLVFLMGIFNWWRRR
ncbi:MAG TPA: Gldg family protein [Chloroflexia bacterium]|nr:Gldg family protein [Chloroflexia bacterium]